MKFLSSGKVFQKVQAVRDQIAEVQGKLVDLDNAPVPYDEAMARVRRWIEGRQSEVSLTNWALKPRSAHGPSGQYGWSVGHPNDPPRDLLSAVLSVFCTVSPETIEAAMEAEIKAKLAKREPGPPVAERPKIREQLEQKLTQLEIKEEAEIEKIEASGYIVHRRADARPEIILGEVTQ